MFTLLTQPTKLEHSTMMTSDTTSSGHGTTIHQTTTPGGAWYATAHKNRRSIGYAAVVTVACGVLAIVLSVSLTGGGENQAPSSAATSIPAATRPLSLWLESLPDSTVERIHSYATPQSQAFQWLDAHPEVQEMDDSRKTQLFSLVTFYYAMEGPQYGNQWMMMPNGVSECYEWVVCNEEGAATSLVVHDLNLFQEGLLVQPRIPPEIALLTELESLSLRNNSITMPLSLFLPSEIYQMNSLSKLALDQNSFFGPLPSGLGQMTNLKELLLWKNQLGGSLLPNELHTMTSLEVLDMSYNAMTGTLPSQLGLMTQLSGLFLRENVDLAGPLPTEVGRLTHLTHVNLGKCSLTGSIPTEYGMLSKLADRSIWLEGNQLEGTLPAMIGSWTDLGLLLLNGNGFTGSIPSEIGLMNSLEEISLYENNLRGSIPSELGLLTDATVGLARVYLYSNELTGEIPTELGALGASGVEGLRLQNNPLLVGTASTICLFAPLEHMRAVSQPK